MSKIKNCGVIGGERVKGKVQTMTTFFGNDYFPSIVKVFIYVWLHYKQVTDVYASSSTCEFSEI